LTRFRILGADVVQYDFTPEKANTKYAWITVERNEGQRFVKQLIEMSKHSEELDIIIVDGGSSDESINTSQLHSLNVKHLLISEARAGFSRDLQIGLIFALNHGYSGVITSDGNGKDSIPSVVRFISALESGFDFIQGSRFIKFGSHVNTPTLRYLGIRFISSPITTILSGFYITDSTNGFRGYSRRLLTHSRLRLGRRDFRGYGLVSYLPVSAGRAKLRCIEVPVTRSYPPAGPTPTKIVSPTQWLQIFLDLFRAAFTTYPDLPLESQEEIIP
jgi:dolichol-phosphate mannosyltransferase